MNMEQNIVAVLAAKEEIRELAMLYSRGVDRKDIELLRSLYARNSTDDHGRFYCGDAAGYLSFLERSLPRMRMSGHYICNHLISVDGDQGEGEVYALAYHLYPDGKGGTVEDFMAIRYIDRYCREDGRWKFASRVVSFDHHSVRPTPTPEHAPLPPAEDPSYKSLSLRLFARGTRP